jgi:hypothetical protein
MTRDIVLKCPVCEGKGRAKFDLEEQECKACGGKGVLWGKETDNQLPYCPVPQIFPQPYVPPFPQPSSTPGRFLLFPPLLLGARTNFVGVESCD